MAIPYMWSKSKSARHIYNVINAHTKDRKENLLVDLFTGWFAISEIFIQEWWQTINNDKNKYVMALLEKTLEWLTDEVYNWVSREKFEDVIKNPSKYEDWYVWYIQCIWSFWNNQKWYLYWRDIEEIKKQADDLVVKKEVWEIIKKLIPNKYIKGILKQDNIWKRRIAFKKVCNVIWKRIDVNRLESLERLKKLEKFLNQESVVKLNGMQRLQNLERLQRLQNKENIKDIIKGKSYDEIGIPKDAIVYCDPPYNNTATYSEWWFNHKEFWDYIRKLSKTNKVFVSEYTAPKDFRIIYEFSQKSCLQGWSQSHNNQPHECLFVYNW